MITGTDIQQSVITEALTHTQSTQILTWDVQLVRVLHQTVGTWQADGLSSLALCPSVCQLEQPPAEERQQLVAL